MDWKTLRSGSDVRGLAVDQPGQPAVLTEEIAERLGFAFGQWLAQKLGLPTAALTIAVGRDSRVSGPTLAAAVRRGAAQAGARVLDCGLCTTPAMFMTTVTPETACQGAVMLTASHHPWTRNGLKLFTRAGGLGGEDIAWLLDYAQSCALPGGAAAAAEEIDYLKIYAALLRQRVLDGLDTTEPQPLGGLKIAVDAGNGAGGFYADLLKELGADVSGSQFLEPDGRFPNHIPNPEDAGAMASISQAVTRSGADLGVIFDADCDRAAIVDATGQPINRNRLIALIAAVLLSEQPGATIVTDSVTSAGLTRFIEAKGGVHYRYKRGYRNVIDEALRLNQASVDCPLAIETSGHAALRENHFLDDGMYLVTRLLVAAVQARQGGGTLSDWIKELGEPVEEQELRLSITAPDFAAAGQAAMATLLGAATGWPDCRRAGDDREGVRLLFTFPQGEGFLQVRLSVHDPVLPVNAESEVPGGGREMLTRLLGVLQNCPGIDCALLAEQVK